MPASSAIALKVDESAGKRYASVVAAAPEKVECPDGYAGKLGRPILVLIDGSSCTGRGLKYFIFVSQQPTAASCIDMLSSAYARAARTSLIRASRMRLEAIKFQCPG